MGMTKKSKNNYIKSCFRLNKEICNKSNKCGWINATRFKKGICVNKNIYSSQKKLEKSSQRLIALENIIENFEKEKHIIRSKDLIIANKNIEKDSRRYNNMR